MTPRSPHEWLYRPGVIPHCIFCGLDDPLWRCALEHGHDCERPECKPKACIRSTESATG